MLSDLYSFSVLYLNGYLTNLLYLLDKGSSHHPNPLCIGILLSFVLKFLTLSFLKNILIILKLPLGVVKSPSFLFKLIPLLPIAHFTLYIP